MSKPFNFYTFPRPVSGRFNRDVCLNSDCIDFHEKVGTDMARWIYKGVNYFQYVTLETVEKIVTAGNDEGKSDGGLQETVDGLKDEDKAAFGKLKEGYLKWAQGEEQVRSPHADLRHHGQQRTHQEVSLQAHRRGDS